MNSNVRKIDNIKHQVKQLILDNSYREVTPGTKYIGSGIYMIYINHFISEKIVPIYIGQAKDIQRRYKQHLSEILALNRLSFDEYNKYFFSKSSSFYEGKFKTSKLFKYMLENNCTLKDFHMVVLEEVKVESLDQKEQEYFQRLLPSFFGFNQLSSFLKQLKFRFSNTPISNEEIDEYLRILLKDIEGIHSYYDYGFTRFNFEHSIPKDISYQINNKDLQDLLDNDKLLRFNEVKLSLYELCKRYIPNFEEIKRLREKKNKLYQAYKIANDECYEALDLLKIDVIERFSELKIYNEEAIKNFIYSIEFENNQKYKELFLKYLKSIKSMLDFYEIFDEQIEDVKKKIKERNNKNIPYSKVMELFQKREDEMRLERYKLIFPSCQFDSFSLGDRSNNLTININNSYNLFNTCYLHIYISNNAINKSFEIRKEPFIIRFDYCYIDIEGKKTENKYYIDNETTRNCKSGIEYFEKDYYNMWAVKREKFKISSIINKELDNSFISVLAEYKHGINDYTIKDKQLVNLSIVLDEIQKITDAETVFSINATESERCLKMCLLNEQLLNNEIVETLLTNKISRIKKSRKTPIKKVVKTNEPKVYDKVTRSEIYKQKILKKSENAIKVFNYLSSREKVTAQCNGCGYEWKIRSDHLLSRPYCPLCRKMKNKI